MVMKPQSRKERRTALFGAFVCALIAAPDVPCIAGVQAQRIDARLESAGTAPCSLAARMYREIAADSTAPDSIRMVAAGMHADAAFAAGDFAAARDSYARAASCDKNPGYFLYRSGLAALKCGDTATAVSCFTRCMAANDSDLSNRVRVMLGDLACASGAYERAMKLFQETGNFSAKNNWSVPAFIGKLTCAKYLGLADSAAVFDRLLSLYAKSMLEKERYKRAKELPLQKPKKTDERQSDPPAPAKDPLRGTANVTAWSDSSFTLQIGAFGSRERAQELKNRLSKKFKGVTCMPAVVSDRTFYRVWIGEFATREQAESFGRNRLSGQGQEYRVVVRQ
jgi:septal ring-binding cell division protein DamX